MCWLRGKCVTELEYVPNTSSVNEMNTGVRYSPEAAALITMIS